MSMSGRKKKTSKKKNTKKAAPVLVPGATTLKTAAKVGDSSLDIADNTGFKVGDLIGIDMGTSAEERNEIAGFGSILCASPLKFDHAAGAPVVKVDAPPAAAAVEEEAVLEPLLAPVAPVSYAMPSMQVAYAVPAAVAMPTAVAMPATTSYAVAAPMTTAYAMPATTASYAMPATTASYAMAAPMTSGTYAMPAAAPYAMPAQSQYAI